mgnify:CR=1 FL=1
MRKNNILNWIKLSSFIFALSSLFASCSNDIDETLQPAGNGTLQFVVGDFPAFGESGLTRAIGTQDEGKTAWENGDQILVTLTSQKYGEQAAALTYDGSSWSTEASLSYLENETPIVSVFYAPCYEVTEEGTMQLRSGMQLGMTEYLFGNYEMENGIMTITFEGAIRTYNRLRIATVPEATLTVTTTDFTPAGATEVATAAYTLTADDKGNAYLYGTFAKDATVTVMQGDVIRVSYPFTAETEQGKSYALDARPVIDLSQYSEGEIVEISSGGRIIGDGNEYNLTLNITADATVIFDVRTSGVNLGGSITVSDGKTLTLLVEGNAEHTVKGGISFGNGSNVIIEGDLTQENNKLTVTSSGGNAGIGANGGVTAGDITIRNARVDATGSGSSEVSGAAIGTSDASMGDILIDNSIVIAVGGYYNSDVFMEISHAAAIGMGYYGGTMGNITLKDSEITASNNGDGLASVIGAGSQNKAGDNNAGTLGDIIITNTDLNLSMVISNKNTYAAIIGPGIGYSYAWTNMGKIIFTDVTQARLDEMIANWLPSDFNEWGAYALGRGYDGCAYKKETFGGVWVSDGNGNTVQIGNENGYYCLNEAKQ